MMRSSAIVVLAEGAGRDASAAAMRVILFWTRSKESASSGEPVSSFSSWFSRVAVRSSYLRRLSSISCRTSAIGTLLVLHPA
jgi:hypothetical protein